MTVTEFGGTGLAETTVTVEPSPPGTAFILTATGFKVRGLQKAQLDWSGVPEAIAQVNVWRNGVVIATVANTGRYIDNINVRGSGTYVYQLSYEDEGTETKSNEATVSL